MPRDSPLDPPSLDAVTEAAETVLGGSISDVTLFDDGLNSVYRIDGDRPAVLKAATLSTEVELMTEARVLSRISNETDVPVPDVLGTGSSDGPLQMSYFVMSYCEGREATGLLELSSTDQERLVSESGRHLGDIHNMNMTQGGDMIAEDFGRLSISDGDFTVKPGYATWHEWFDELATRAVDGLLGEGYCTDDDPRFSDLEPVIRRRLNQAKDLLSDRNIQPAILLGNDYRVSDLVLAYEGSDPIINGILDFGGCFTGDSLLDLALVEDAVIGVPLGGTERATHLRESLRTEYLSERNESVDFDEERYSYYQLYARTKRLGSFGYWVQFAREDDPEEVARRWRGFVQERLGEVG